MKNLVMGFLLAAGLLLTSNMAHAQDNILFGLSLFKYDVETEGPNLGNVENKNTHYDIKLGYQSGALYLGGIYSLAESDNGATTEERTGLGGTIGYHNGGFLLDFSYFLQAQYDLGTTKLTNGSGYGLDIGYNARMAANFYLGLQLSYKSFTFKERESSGATVDVENKIKSQLLPMVNLGFLF